jgi:hypothetical protein
LNEALLIYPNIISKNQNNVWLGEVRSLVTPIFSYRAADVNPLVLALGLSLLLSFLSFFPQLPTLFPPPSSLPTELGGSALSHIIQKQETHGTQSMGF